MIKFGNQNSGITEDIEYMKNTLAQYNPENPSDTSTYINLKSWIDETELIQKYGENSWQATIIQQNMGRILNELNTYQYGTTKNQESYQKVRNEYEQYIQKLENNDWKYFAQTELQQVKQEIQVAEIEKQKTIDKIQMKALEEKIKNLEIQKQVLNWRLEKEISYARSELNSTLLNYQSYQEGVQSYENKPSDDYNQKVKYNSCLKEAAIAKYSIENNVTANKVDDARGMLLQFFAQYGIFMIAIIIMIAGTIISEEFNKGTIKLLLVKPYKRWKILLSKLLSCITAMVIIVGILFVMQLVVGGILFGFESLTTPEVHYNFNTNQVETMNIFAYVGLVAITKLPMFILTIMIAFMLGSLFTNSALSIVIALLGFMSSSIINMMALQLNLGFMKYFITPNWDLTPYLFGGLPEFPGITLEFSIGINIAYFILMLLPAFIVFKKKNIKNI